MDEKKTFKGEMTFSFEFKEDDEEKARQMVRKRARAMERDAANKFVDLEETDVLVVDD